MTIKEAIITVLREEKSALSISELYEGITTRKLFEFQAKKPLEIIAKVVRKHLDNGKPSQMPPMFKMTEDKRVNLIR